jgi:AraC-like DNA-binding protein
MAKKSKVTGQFPKKRFLKLLSATKECSLSLEDRLVYSMLAYLSIKKVAVSKRQLARRLCLDKDTVGRAIDRLGHHHLVDPATMTALQPDQDCEDWFVRINRPSQRWQEQLAYLLVPLPRVLPPQISWRTLVVHCFLLSKADGEGRVRTNAAQIARILSLDSRTVRKAFNALENKMMIEVDERHRMIRAARLDAAWLDFFQDQTKESKPPTFSVDRPWEDMSEAEIQAHVYDPNITPLGQLIRKMRFIGKYSSLNIENVRSWIRRYQMDERTLASMFNEVEKAHASSQKKGNFLGQNSYPFLLHRINKKYGADNEAS